MRNAFARLGVLAGALALAAACSTSGKAASPSASPSGTAATAAPLAEGGGISVSQAELDEKLAVDQLMDLRQREYELRKEALDEVLGEKLLQKEAQARGVTVEELTQREVEEKAGKPDAAEIERFYVQNQRRLAGIPREQALATVEAALSSRNRDARAAAYRRELIKKHGVRVRLAPPRYDVAVPSDAPALGSPKAAVTIVEFADYQCPFCHQAQTTVDEVLKRYPGQVRLVHRDFPLDGIHPRATPAARASRCAGEQGKFWEYHRGLLSVMTELSDADLTKRAEELRLNMTSFASCLAQPSGDAAIRASLEAGRKLGVSATPTFFINGRRLVGAKGLPDFVDAIEDELARASGN